MIPDIVKQLRQEAQRYLRAAEAVERLLPSDPSQHPKAARAIERGIDGNLRRGHGRPLGSKNKSKSYHGTHWMQQPENKARVAEMARARGAARRGVVEALAPVVPVVATVPETPKKRHHKGLHWTQKPQFASKLKQMHRQMMLTKKRAKKENR